MSKRNFVSFIEDIDEVRNNSKIGFAGFASLDTLKETLNDQNYKPDPISISSKKLIKKHIKNTFLTASKKIKPKENTHTFISTIDNNFVRDNLGGVGGYSPYNSTIHLFIDNKILQEEYLTNESISTINSTFLHEYHHSQFWIYNKWDTILDGLIAEGLAEHFAEQITGIKSIFYKPNGQEYYDIISKNGTLKNSKESEYEECFTNENKYPMWTGYYAGYYLVSKFLKEHPKTTISEITRDITKIKEILI